MSLVDKTKQFFRDKWDTIGQLDIGWDNRPYDFYLIFGQNETENSPWIKSNWESEFEPLFNLLLQQTPNYNQTGLRATKYSAEKRIAKKDNREFVYFSEMKLGRLRWDYKSHEKWTIENNTDNYFQDLELWTPIWTVCEKRNAPPDIFISISNENDFESRRQIQFGYLIVIAVAKNLKIDSENIIKKLSERINSKITILKNRRWGKPEKSGNWTFVNGVQDTFSNGIYKGKNLHTIDFKDLEFEPFWKIIHRQS